MLNTTTGLTADLCYITLSKTSTHLLRIYLCCSYKKNTTNNNNTRYNIAGSIL